MTLQRLLKAELELRDALLDAARDDDSDAARWRAAGGFPYAPAGSIDFPWTLEGPRRWPHGRALDELRLVERRIFQIKEALRG
jgi:hypothetical protein